MSEEIKSKKIKSEIFDDFTLFRSRLNRLVKDMTFNPSMRVVVSARRDLSKSVYRQIEYILEITDDKNVHFFSIDDLVKGNFAVPAAPNMPEVEEEVDTTV